VKGDTSLKENSASYSHKGSSVGTELKVKNQVHYQEVKKRLKNDGQGYAANRSAEAFEGGQAFERIPNRNFLKRVQRKKKVRVLQSVCRKK